MQLHLSHNPLALQVAGVSLKALFMEKKDKPRS
jgi:hypothetical protein